MISPEISDASGISLQQWYPHRAGSSFRNRVRQGIFRLFRLPGGKVHRRTGRGCNGSVSCQHPLKRHHNHLLLLQSLSQAIVRFFEKPSQHCRICGNLGVQPTVGNSFNFRQHFNHTTYKSSILYPTPYKTSTRLLFPLAAQKVSHCNTVFRLPEPQTGTYRLA